MGSEPRTGRGRGILGITDNLQSAGIGACCSALKQGAFNTATSKYWALGTGLPVWNAIAEADGLVRQRQDHLGSGRCWGVAE